VIASGPNGILRVIPHLAATGFRSSRGPPIRPNCMPAAPPKPARLVEGLDAAAIRLDESTRMIEAVLFDLDRTLIHCTAAGHNTVLLDAARNWHVWLRSSGCPVPCFDRYFRALRYRVAAALVWSRLRRREVPLVRLLRRFHEKRGVDFTENRFEELVMQLGFTLKRLYPADPEAVTTLRAIDQMGLKMGLVSNTMLPAAVVDEHLREAGLVEFLPVRVYSSDTGYKKPNPMIFQLALNRLNIAAENALFVGDRLNADVAGPARLSMKTVLISPLPVRGGRARPDGIVRRLSELPAIIDSLSGVAQPMLPSGWTCEEVIPQARAALALEKPDERLR